MATSCTCAEQRRRRRETRVTELPDVASAAARMIRGVGRRAADDPAGLPYLRELRDVLDVQLLAAIDGCRREGWSWSHIGRELGISPQAVQQWHARRTTRGSEPAPV